MRCRALVAIAVAGTATAMGSPAAYAAPTPAPKRMQADWHGTSWSVPITLSGRATKRTKVSVSSACAIGTCTALTTADAKGKWKTRFDAIVKPGTSSLAVKLASGTQSLTRTFSILAPVDPKPGQETVMVIGDSLAVGTRPILPELFSAQPVTTQAADGRSLQTGLKIFEHTPLDQRIRVAVFSLFTNNDPSDVAGFEAAIRESMERLGSRRCAVWFTIRRPAVRKVSYRAANDALLTLAAKPEYGGRLIVVPWYATVEAQLSLLTKDRVHPTAAGYRLRAELTAKAVERCPVSPA